MRRFRPAPDARDLRGGWALPPENVASCRRTASSAATWRSAAIRRDAPSPADSPLTAFPATPRPCHADATHHCRSHGRDPDRPAGTAADRPFPAGIARAGPKRSGPRPSSTRSHAAKARTEPTSCGRARDAGQRVRAVLAVTCPPADASLRAVWAGQSQLHPRAVSAPLPVIQQPRHPTGGAKQRTTVGCHDLPRLRRRRALLMGGAYETQMVAQFLLKIERLHHLRRCHCCCRHSCCSWSSAAWPAHTGPLQGATRNHYAARRSAVSPPQPHQVFAHHQRADRETRASTEQGAGRSATSCEPRRAGAAQPYAPVRRWLPGGGI